MLCAVLSKFLNRYPTKQQLYLPSNEPTKKDEQDMLEKQGLINKRRSAIDS